jgi:hypothetical protein
MLGLLDSDAPDLPMSPLCALRKGAAAAIFRAETLNNLVERSPFQALAGARTERAAASSSTIDAAGMLARTTRQRDELTKAALSGWQTKRIRVDS